MQLHLCVNLLFCMREQILIWKNVYIEHRSFAMH